MGKRKVKFVSPETIKKFLNENNISLDSLGGEKEQEDFISRLSETLISYRRINSSQKISKYEKSIKLQGKGQEILNILQEVNFSPDMVDKLAEEFIPQPALTKAEIDEIKTLKEKMAQMEKEIQETKAKVAAYEKAKESSDAVGEKSEVSEEHSETDTTTAPKKDDWITGEVPSKRKTREQSVYEVEGDVLDRRDETASEIFRDMLDMHKQLRETKKDLRRTNPSIKTGRTIGEGVVDIVSWARDVMVCDIIHGGISNLDHDIFAGGAFIAFTGLAVTGYVGARVAGKAIKGVAKLGVKTIGGAITLAGKAGKALFKAGKGTAKKCKAKADNLREKRRNKKIGRTEEALEEANEVTKNVLDLTERKLKASIFPQKYIKFLSEDQKQYLEDIKDATKRGDIEDKLIQENDEYTTKAKSGLRHLTTIGLVKEFQDKFGIEEADAKYIIDNSFISESGELIIPDNSPVTIDELADSFLDEDLMDILAIPQVGNFNLDELQCIEYYLSNPEEMGDLKNLVKTGQIREDVEIYIRLAKREIDISQTNGYIDVNSELETIGSYLDTARENEAILEEAYGRDLFDVAKELRAQILEMTKEFEQTKGETSFRDSARRETLRKIAQAKVEDLEKSRIIKIIQHDDSKGIALTKRAERALSQDLVQDIEHATDIKRDKINYEQETEEHEEK